MKDGNREAVERAVSLLKFFADGCSCTRDTHPCPRCMARDFIKEFDGEAAPKKKEHNCLNCETAKKPGWKGNCGTCPPLEDSGVRPRVREDAARALATDAIKEVDRLRAENEKMKAEAKDHKTVAVMLSTENEKLQEENAKLRADFPPAPPLPVHDCKCYACEYLRRKQKEDWDKREKEGKR